MIIRISIAARAIVIGVVAALVFAGMAGTGAAAYTWTTVSTNQQMTDSWFDVIAGHKYVIQTTGKWGCDPNPPVCGYVDANGNNRYDSNTLYPDERVSVIVFTVGFNKIGSGTNVVFTSSQSGRLYSIFNDVPGGFYNNVGGVISAIEDISPVATTPAKPPVTLTKSASPYSIRQFQEANIKVSIENSGTTDIKAIEVMDSIHPSFDLISGDFPNPKKYDIIRAGESREIQYTIKAKESGTFTLDSVIVTYADKDGNIQEIKSEPVSIKVVPSLEGVSSTPSGQPPKLPASVSLTGEKTDVVLGEDILLKLSAVNLITKPKMRVQVIIIPPSGMSVTSSEFSKSGTNQFTANYELEPGDGKDIGVAIKPNQIGDFNVNGRIIYYFGDEKDKAEDQTLNLPIKVRKEIASTPAQNPTENPVQKSIPGFEIIISISVVLFIFLKKRGIKE